MKSYLKLKKSAHRVLLKLSVVFMAAAMVLLVACNKKEVPTNGVAVEIYIDISYVDQNGNDLLNPENPTSYNPNDFGLYYLKNGKKTLYYMSNYNEPHGYSKVWYFPESKLYCFRLFPPADTSYLQISNDITDTIRSSVEIYNGGASMFLTKLWYNDSLVWPNDYSQAHNYIVIKKQIE
jgi:hypothetical protein